MDHGLRDVDPLLVAADEPFPPGHPTESALDETHGLDHRIFRWRHRRLAG